MAECEFLLPCESTISSDGDALIINNNGNGGVLKAESVNNPAITSNSNNGFGLLGVSNTNHGLRGISSERSGVFGSVMGASGLTHDLSGVCGESSSAPGVAGQSATNAGVLGRSASGVGIVGIGESNQVQGNSEGVVGISRQDVGLLGISEGASLGVFGQSSQSTGVYGWGVPGMVGISTTPGDGIRGFATVDGIGVSGYSASGPGVLGVSDDAEEFVSVGVEGQSFGKHFLPNNIGVRGVAGESGTTAVGVLGIAMSNPGTGIFGRGSGTGSDRVAGIFDGAVEIMGPLFKGGGGFKIDHPLDPANKYCSHSFVESEEMKNIYDGFVALDDNGEALVELPDWFEALNGDFRYQLTAVGEPAPGLYIAQEISNHRFSIGGGKPGMKVCWQVTGIRRDAWALANPLKVEEEKPGDEKGYYQYPECYQQAPENNTFWKGNSKILNDFTKPKEDTSQEKLRETIEQIDYLSQKINFHKSK